jgi:beta-glucuronidase
VRFESVNYRSKIWLNGKPIGKNRGAYLPFEIRLPPGCSSAAASTTWSSASTRAASRPTSRPPAVDRGQADGGWWNYGGLLREVYLRKINDVDFNTVVVRPDLPCATCRGDGHLPRHAAQLRPERPARRRSARASARGASPSAGWRSAPSASPR